MLSKKIILIYNFFFFFFRCWRSNPSDLATTAKSNPEEDSTHVRVANEERLPWISARLHEPRQHVPSTTNAIQSVVEGRRNKVRVILVLLRRCAVGIPAPVVCPTFLVFIFPLFNDFFIFNF